MLNFYKQATAIFIVLLLVSSLSSLVFINETFLSYKLLPAEDNDIDWKATTDTDATLNGNSSIVVNEVSHMLDYSFEIRPGTDYPYASLKLDFLDEQGKPLNFDLSNFGTLSLSIKCTPENVLAFLSFSLDQELTEREGKDIYRISERFISCTKEWSNVEVDLHHLEVPDWWLDSLNLNLSNRDYKLDKVSGIAFGSSAQSARELALNVKISKLVFYGHDWRYAYVLGFFLLLVWGIYIFWLVRSHTQCLIKDIKDKIQKDRPFVAYQQLSIEPQYDKGKKLILDFMATEYANPDLSLDQAVSKLGVSRTKINDVLKDELGYTFTSYLNKLRLTEATRLLAEKEDANVAEIAYSVGYKNVPYFNRLFKNEYGCTPKVFKNVCKK